MALDPSPVGLEAARALFADAKLPFPTVPAEFHSHFHEVDKWHFEANAPKGHPYNMDAYIRRARRSAVNDFVVLAHAGHGVNSYAIHYFVVQKPLAVFLQIGWGGVYMDAARSVALVTRCFALTDSLVAAVAEARATRRLTEDERIIVTASDFNMVSLLDVRRRGARWRTSQHQTPDQALEAAIALVTDAAPVDVEDVRRREKRRALARLGANCAIAFFRAARAELGGPKAIEMVNEALDEGQSLEQVLLSDDGAEYSFAVRGRGRKFRIIFGWSDGRGLIGDGGQWDVEFDQRGQIATIQPDSVWIS